jgi:hypothetical protein
LSPSVVLCLDTKYLGFTPCAFLFMGIVLALFGIGGPSLECRPDLEVAVHNVAESLTQPTTRLNAGRT